MVMEYVSGQTLEKLIAAGGLATDLAMKYAIQIADAVARAHTTGIVHRDLAQRVCRSGRGGAGNPDLV
jgi:serine/threonine protein kinase